MMRMTSYSIDQPRTESMGFLSFCMTYVLLFFVRLFPSFFFIRPFYPLFEQLTLVINDDDEGREATADLQSDIP